jgi:hypothetical protein
MIVQMNTPFAWEKDFPKGYGHTSIVFLKRCLGFEDAKNGDLNAAQHVVRRCVKQKRLQELREHYPDAVLLPVLSKNQMPTALAQAIGLPIWIHVHLIHTIPRKLLNAMQRLLHKPEFDGFILSDTNYILVDDIITQGGTIAALRRFVTVRGGRVVATVALAFSIGSHVVAPLRRYVTMLIIKFGYALIFFLLSLGIAFSVWGLTNSQVKYLLRFKSIRNILMRLCKENYR